MKVRSKLAPLKASRIFTDREEPRRAFWKKYETACAEPAEDIRVLSYYGIGGIGKTSLLKKLMEEMDERVDNPLYVYFDFNLHQESRAVLDALKNKLTEQGFSFPLYEVGAYIYAKKVGEDPDRPEVKQTLAKSPVVELLLSVAGEIPVIGSAAKIIELADRGVSAFKGYMQEHRRELRQIEYLEPEELYDYLPELFAEDLTHGLAKKSAPLVVFLDTYEQLVNEMSSVGEPLNRDLWIRGERGLVQNIPGVLWVIAGREKLKWERFDAEWSEALEQHLLGSLSERDSDQFLEFAGVTDAQLRRGIYALTDGTPVYLDLCVDQHRRLEERGIIPEIGMFGRDSYELIERFARYMDDARKDIVYVLSCLGCWDDGMLAGIAGEVIPGFSLTTYEKVKGLSFITQSDDGDYNIHQTVGDVLLRSCPEVLKIRTAEKGISFFLAELKDANPAEPRCAEALTGSLRLAMLLYAGRSDALWEFVRDNLAEPLRQMANSGFFARAERALEPLLRRAEQEPGTRLYGGVYGEYSRILREKGDYPGCLAAGEKSWNCLYPLLGDHHRDTLLAGYAYAAALWQIGRYPEALTISKQMYQSSCELLGEDHPETLTAMRSLALDYYYNDLDEEALELNNRVLEKMLHILGREHRETHITMANRVTFLRSLRRYEEALAMAEEVLSLRLELFGEDHPDVLMSKANKAAVLERLNRWEEALEIRRDTMIRRREVLGALHPATLSNLISYGDILYTMRRYAEALPAYREAWEGRQEVLGQYHKKTLSAGNDLAYALKNAGQPEESLDVFREVIDGRLKTLGEMDADTAFSYVGLGDALYNLDRYAEALPVYRAALKIRREVYPDGGKNLAKSVNDLAYTLMALKESEEALERFREVREMYAALYGEESEQVMTATENIATNLAQLGRNEEALAAYQVALAGRVKLLKPADPAILRTMGNIAVVLNKLGCHRQQAEIYTKLYSICAEHLGERHEKTLSYHYDLCASRLQFESAKDIRPLLERLYADCAAVYGAEDERVVRIATVLKNA